MRERERAITRERERGKKGIGEGVLLAPRLAIEAIFIARRCEEREREKTREKREKEEWEREERGHHERRQRMRATGKFPSHA